MFGMELMCGVWCLYMCGGAVCVWCKQCIGVVRYDIYIWCGFIVLVHVQSEEMWHGIHTIHVSHTIYVVWYSIFFMWCTLWCVVHTYVYDTCMWYIYMV